MRYVAGFATLLMLTTGTWSPLSGQQAGSAQAVLRPNDAIRITVWEQPTLSGEFTVGGNGTIQHPLYQTVSATGVPIQEVEQRLRTFLLRYDTNPRFLVEPLVRVYVGGSVRLPTLYLVRADATVGQAVGQAGGPADDGRLDRVVVHRGGTELRLDLTSEQDARVVIQSGDQIMVGRRRNVLQEYVGPAASLFAAVASIVGILR
jgi:polysaccharide biosynthesis/export protein